MSDGAVYTRSLLRRLFAYVIDTALVGIVTSLAIALLGLLTGDNFRLSGGLVNFTQCDESQEVLGPDQLPLSTSGFTKVQVCSTTSNFLLRDRRAVFIRETKGADASPPATWSWSYNEFITFPVDDQNRAVRPIYLDLIFWLALILGAAAFEASRLQATPGKLLLGLAVHSTTPDRVSSKSALIRNSLKNCWALYGVFEFSLRQRFLDYDTLFQNAAVIIPPDLSEQLQVSSLVGLSITVFMIAMYFGLFFPWRKAGRGLYDKAAGTYVIRTG